MPEEKIYQIEELPDLKVNWTESYKCLDEPLLEYVWEVANHFLTIRICVGSSQPLPA